MRLTQTFAERSSPDLSVELGKVGWSDQRRCYGLPQLSVLFYVLAAIHACHRGDL